MQQVEGRKAECADGTSGILPPGTDARKFARAASGPPHWSAEHQRAGRLHDLDSQACRSHCSSGVQAPRRTSPA